MSKLSMKRGPQKRGPSCEDTHRKKRRSTTQLLLSEKGPAQGRSILLFSLPRSSFLQITISEPLAAKIPLSYSFLPLLLLYLRFLVSKVCSAIRFYIILLVSEVCLVSAYHSSVSAKVKVKQKNIEKEKMLHRTNYSSFEILSFLLKWQHIRLLGTKSSFRYSRKEYDDDEEKRNHKMKEGDEGHVYLHKSRGQHILTNPRVLDSIVQKADVRPTDTVLEIGPGTGNLTLKLLEVAEKVVAIEIDKRMVEILINRASKHGLENRLTVVCKDALKTDLPEFDVIAANIPYGISSPLIAKFVFGTNQFRSATLLLQKEFARRLLAGPGDSEFNRLAVNVKLVADVEFVMDVSKRDFVPCPKVDSSVVKIRPKANIPNVDMNEWCAFTRTCFGKKNKTLGATFKQKKKVSELLRRSQKIGQHKDNVITNNYYDDEENETNEEDDKDENFYSLCSEKEMGLFRDKIVGILKAGGFEEKRPSKLSNEELLHLLFLFNQSGIHFNDKAK